MPNWMTHMPSAMQNLHMYSNVAEVKPRSVSMPTLMIRNVHSSRISQKARVDVQIPIKAEALGGMISTRTVSFEKGIGHGDFFDRVCAYMELPRDKARLGYKWNFERRNDLPHRLLTSEDLCEAFDKAVEMSNSKRRRKVVIMEIVNLVSITSSVLQLLMPWDDKDLPIVHKKSASKRKRGDEKISDLPATNEFVKLKLHKKANKLRTPHVSGMSVTPQAIDLPNKLPFQTVADSKDVNTSSDNGDTDIVSDYEHDLTVADVVKAIHLEYPQLNMPQYERALAIQGIIYARSIPDFDQKFYVDIVKMAPGAVELLIRKALKMAIARRPDAHMGRKARRDEDEDLLHT
jgi:hypothetical protein